MQKINSDKHARVIEEHKKQIAKENAKGKNIRHPHEGNTLPVIVTTIVLLVGVLTLIIWFSLASHK